MNNNLTSAPVPDQFKGRKRVTHFYTVTAKVPAGGSIPATLNIDADADAVLLGAAVVVTNAADTDRVSFAHVLVQLTNTSTGSEAQNTPTHLHALAGTAEQPAMFPAPVLLPSNSSMRVQFTSRAAADVNVRLTFYGYRVPKAG